MALLRDVVGSIDTVHLRAKKQEFFSCPAQWQLRAAGTSASWEAATLPLSAVLWDVVPSDCLDASK